MLAQAYPNYYMDTHLLLAAVENAILRDAHFLKNVDRRVRLHHLAFDSEGNKFGLHSMK